MLSNKNKCKACKILFVPKPSTKGLYCNKRCKALGQRKWKVVRCKACGKELRRHASELKRTRMSVCNRVCQAKAKNVPRETVVALREQGYSYRQIGKALGFGKSKAERILKYGTP